MTSAVLLVASDTEFLSRLTAALKPYSPRLTADLAQDRTEAMALLADIEFDKLVTCLEIPRIMDGYRFLSAICNRKIAADRIVVITKQETVRDLDFLGIKNVFPEKDSQGILEAILRGIKTDAPVARQEEPPSSPVDTTKISTSLNQVMGPVGSFIFDQALARWKNRSDAGELLELIATEIGDAETASRFYQLIR